MADIKHDGELPDAFSMEVVDATGRLVFQKDISSVQLNRIEVGDLPTGFYVVRLLSGGVLVAVEKLVVQR